MHYNVRSIKENKNGQIIIATYGGGIYKSDNAGENWVQMNTGLVNLNITSLVIDSNGNIFAGTWGNDVFVSYDDANSWTKLGISYLYINSLSVNSNDEIIVGTNGGGIFILNNENAWVSVGINNSLILDIKTDADGSLFSCINGFGLSRSDNRGDSWKNITSQIDLSRITCFAISPNENVFAGSGYYEYSEHGELYKSNEDLTNWEKLSISEININSIIFRNNDEVFIGTGFNGVYGSKDGGDTWENIGWDKNSESGGDVSFAFDLDKNIIASSYNKIYYSSDNGDSWKLIGEISEFGPNITSIKVNLAGDIYACTSFGLYKSTNKGETWIKMDIPEDQIYSVVFNSDQIYAGGYGDIYLSNDDGLSWEVIDSGLANVGINCLEIDQDGYIYAGTTWGIFKSLNSITSVYTQNNNYPLEYRLYQNYPNPFNPATKIKYQIANVEMHLDASLLVTLKVYDLLGREVATLVNEEKPAGSYEVEFDGSGLSSGIYFYKLQTENYSSVKKMILLK